MGGEGSGRKPSVETIIKQSQPTLTPLGDGLFLPNYSGVQDVALKTHAPLSETIATHIGDSSDPHGATLTQTNLLLTSGTVTVDLTASGSALIRNFLIGTELSGSLVASNYPQGTIYLRYT